MVETKKRIVMFLASVVLFGATQLPADQKDPMKLLGIQKKYHLRDCIVKLNLLWDPATNQSIRSAFFHEMTPRITKAMVSRDFPYFGGHSTENTHYVFYFVDECEKRREYVQKLLDEILLPYIAHFPKYEIEHEGIEPGFDGVTISCCWLD